MLDEEIAQVMSHHPNTEDDADAARLGEAVGKILRRAASHVDAAIDRSLAPLGLTSRQYDLLRASASNEGINQMRLSELTGIDRSTMTDMVTRLVSRGLLRRDKNPHDSRSYIVCVTDSGSDLLAKAEPLAAEIHLAIHRAVEPSGREGLERALSMLAQMHPGGT